MATQIQKNTARLMLKKLQAKLDRLYAEQEAQKPAGEQQMTPMMARNGGMIRKMGDAGTITDPPYNPYDQPLLGVNAHWNRNSNMSGITNTNIPASNSAVNPAGANYTQGVAPVAPVNSAVPIVPNTITPGYSMMNNYDNTAFGGSPASNVLPGGTASTQGAGTFNPADFAFGVNPREDAIRSMGQGPSVNNNLSPYKSPQDQGGGNKFDWGNAGMTALGLVPMMYNLIQGSRKADRLNPQEFQNPYENDARQAMRNRRYNIRPQLERNTGAQNAFNRNVANTGSSRGEMLSNFGAGYAGKMRMDAQAWAEKQNMDNQYLGQQAQMDAQLGQQRAATNLNVRNMNDANQAARRNFLGQSMSDLSGFAQTQQLMGGQREADRMNLDVLKTMSPYAETYFKSYFDKLKRR